MKIVDTLESLLKNPIRAALGALGVLLVVWAVMGSWYTVSEGSKAVITRTGQVIGTQGPGLHFKLPAVDTVYKINVRTQTAEVKRAEGGTHDLQPVHVGMVVRYSIIDEKVRHIFSNYSTDGDMDHYVMTATAESFKAVTANYSAPNLIQKRNEVSHNVLVALQRKVDQYGLVIENVDMTDFGFDPQYMAAVNAKVQEEQKLATQVNVLKRIEVEQQQKVVTAKAEAESTEARAKAEAFQIQAIATAKAKALEIEGKALRENSNVAELRRIEVEMKKAEQWDGKLPQNLYANAPVPFFNMK